jgi:hypothetical protein
MGAPRPVRRTLLASEVAQEHDDLLAHLVCERREDDVDVSERRKPYAT